MDLPKQRSGTVSAASAQGERDHQEDCFGHFWIETPAIPNGTGWLLAVFDGHGGKETADMASQALRSLFERNLETHAGNIPQVLRSLFETLQHRSSGQLSGSTASVVFIPHAAQQAYVAVLGDSPVALMNAHGRLHIGPCHNVRTNRKERSDAVARGGVYRDGYLEDADLPEVGLQMSRSLGDTELNRILDRQPEIETVELGGNGIVLVGTDGLLLSNGEANAAQLKRLLELVEQGADAEALVKDALKRRTGDNVTAVVWTSGVRS